MAAESLRFEVTKLNCGGCAGRAQKALSGVPGVEEASVNLANRMATVEGSAGVQALREALSSATNTAFRALAVAHVGHAQHPSTVHRPRVRDALTPAHFS